MTRPTRTRSLLPTRKWVATQVTAVCGWVIALVTAGHWTTTLKIALVTIIGQALVGWLVPNDNTPAGIPLKRPANQRGAVENALAFACLIVIVAILLSVAFHSPLWLLVLILIVLLFA